MKIAPAPIAVVLLLLGSPLTGENNRAPASAAPAPDSGRIIQFLSRAISWYRQLAAEQHLATEPEDLTFAQENRRVADQVVQQAFEYARSQAQPAGKSQRTSASQAPGQSTVVPAEPQHQGLGQALQKAEQDIQDTQAELQSVKDKLASASPRNRPVLQSQIAELQSELGLMQARHDALQSMVEFVNASNSGGGLGLRAQIEELARSVPAALSRSGAENESTAEPSSSTANNAIASKPEPTGIWGLSADLIRLSGKKHTLEGELNATRDLQQNAADIRAPLLGKLQGLIKRGDELFAAADAAGPELLLQQKQQLDALTAEFKQISVASLPLSKVNVLLDIYRRTLSNWRESVRDQFHEEERALLLRLGLLFLMIAAVFGVGEIWRRTTFRYVHDVRRRYQFLLLRRVVMWTAIVLIIVLAFATQLGSAVTFAGLLTAGVAVALQNVIVSVVAYFFLIGKYGIRVGDRVQIAGVTGEVVDIGLVRIHLMELGGPGESQPSGRVVAFSNSIVFQPTAGVFKQIPGTNFLWHELKLTLAAETEYHTAKERITQAVDAALGKYRDEIEGQRQSVERNLTTVSSAEIQPKVRLHYTAAGIEASVRFPVDMVKAGEMDDHLMKEVITALEREPRLKLIGAELPAAKAGD